MEIRNRNREHAVQQLKKYIKSDDEISEKKFLNSCKANVLIYIGDSLAVIAKQFSPDLVNTDYDPGEIDEEGEE